MFVNHYFYVSFHPHPDPDVIEDRMSRYLGTLDEAVPNIGNRWRDEWMPEISARNIAERDVDYGGMSDTELRAKLDDMTAWMEQQWYVHGHINFVLLSGAALSDMYVEVMQPEDPTESYQILQGHHTRSVDAARGLWELSRMARDSATIRDLFDNHHPRELVARLGESNEGARFLTMLEEFLYEFGWRSDAVYDLADPAWYENPVIPLGNLTRYIELADSHDPEIQYRRSVELAGAADRGHPGSVGRLTRRPGPIRRALRSGQGLLSDHRGPRLLHRPDGGRLLSAASSSPWVSGWPRRAASTRARMCSVSIATRSRRLSRAEGTSGR